MLFGLGVLGVLSLVWVMMIVHSRPGAMAAIVVQTLLLVFGVVVGLYAAPRVEFTSHVVNRVTRGTSLLPAIQSDIKPVVAIGAVIGVMVFALEMVAPERVGAGLTVEILVLELPQWVLWGGITEELIMRWGALSLLTLVLWRVSRKGKKRPSPTIVWSAIVVVALLFGALHLPTVAANYGGLTAELIVLFGGGNAIGGIAFGWLFWRYSLEAAMIAHAFANLVKWTALIGVILF